jgi:hypothetical protein
MRGERRKEPRYVVDSVNLVIGGQSYPVIDISPSSARVSCKPRDYARSGCTQAKLEFELEDRREVYTITPRLVRKTDLYIVIGFEAPRADWATYLSRFDTFHVARELDKQIFD